MFYNDDNTKKEEENFQKNLELVRSVAEVEIKTLNNDIDILDKKLKKMTDKAELTDEESALINDIEVQLGNAVKRIRDMKAVFAESTYRPAVAYYFHVQKLAEEGDEKAKEIYERLKPKYHDLLMKKMGNN